MPNLASASQGSMATTTVPKHSSDEPLSKNALVKDKTDKFKSLVTQIYNNEAQSSFSLNSSNNSSFPNQNVASNGGQSKAVAAAVASESSHLSQHSNSNCGVISFFFSKVCDSSPTIYGSLDPFFYCILGRKCCAWITSASL